MAWTQVPGGWQRVVAFPNAPDNFAQCSGAMVLTSLVNGDQVVYADSGPNLDLNADKTVTVTLPDAIVQRILAENGLNLQLDIVEPSGARNTLLGGVFVVSGNDLVPKVAPHPRATQINAIKAATTVTGLRDALVAYIAAVDP